MQVEPVKQQSGINSLEIGKPISLIYNDNRKDPVVYYCYPKGEKVVITWKTEESTESTEYPFDTVIRYIKEGLWKVI